jgi:hypothetical protein
MASAQLFHRIKPEPVAKFSPRNFDKSSAVKNCRRYLEVRRQFGGNFVTINWHFDRTDYFIFIILLTLLIKTVWYSRKPCFTHNNIETSYQSFSCNSVTPEAPEYRYWNRLFLQSVNTNIWISAHSVLHYGRCSKIVCMFELEVTWSISELSMYFKISHKNKSVHKSIAHFPRLIFWSYVHTWKN